MKDVTARYYFTADSAQPLSADFWSTIAKPAVTTREETIAEAPGCKEPASAVKPISRYVSALAAGIGIVT